MKTFDDLVFKDHRVLPEDEQTRKTLLEIAPDFKGSKQSRITFPNGQKISVVFGKMFYSNGIDTYEAWDLVEDEPRGYLTKEEVTEYMIEIQGR